MALNIDKAKLENAMDQIVKGCNTDVIECMGAVAAKLMPQQGDNELVDATIKDCQKFQSHFNDTKNSLENLIKEICKLCDMGDYLDKISGSFGNVKQRDTSFQTQKIDADKVMG